MIVFSDKKYSEPNGIEIKQIQLNNKAEILKLLVLANKEMPEYIVGLKNYLDQNLYDGIFGAYLKNTNILVGAGLVLDERKISQKSFVDAEKTALLDFLFVDKNYTHNKIGTTLINAIYNYCVNNGFEYIELMCPAKNSFSKNIYDKNDFNRISVTGSLSCPEYFIFKAHTNKLVRNFAKVLYATLLDAYENEVYSFEDYKQEILDGYVPYSLLKLANINLPTFKKLVSLKSFELFDDVYKTLIDEGVSVVDASESLKKCLKIKKIEELQPLKKPSFLSFSNEDDLVNNYLSKRYLLKQVNFVQKTVDETKNRLLNDEYLKHFKGR